MIDTKRAFFYNRSVEYDFGVVNVLSPVEKTSSVWIEMNVAREWKKDGT